MTSPRSTPTNEISNYVNHYEKDFWKIFKMATQVRQNFHEECEEAINRQINVELFASYTYLSMVS